MFGHKLADFPFLQWVEAITTPVVIAVGKIKPIAKKPPLTGV
jgi:hypothetical protein